MTAPAPPVSWTGGGVHPEVLAGAGLVAGLYAGAWLMHRGRRSRLLPASFAAGLLALVLALNGPLHDLSDHYLFSAHMTQHLVLTLVVPPLLLAGVRTGLPTRTVPAERSNYPTCLWPGRGDDP